MKLKNDGHFGGVTRREFLAMTAAAGASIPITGFAKNADDIMRSKGDKRKVCIFSKHLQWLDYDAMAEKAAEIGFDGVDLTVRPGGHVLPERVEGDLPRAVEAVRKVGLDVYMMTTRITDLRDSHTEPILKTASQLGIGYYRMGYLTYNDSLAVSESLKSYRPQLRDLAAMNKHYNIHGAYQNHAGTRVGGPVWDLWILLQDLDPRWIGCQYDVRHATLEGGSCWPLGLKLLSTYIKITAIKDFRWAKIDGKWKAENCPLTEGMVDFKQYFRLVKEYNIDGPISQHFEYPLGGAGKGKNELTIKREEVIDTMRRDVNKLRSMLKEASLSGS